MIFFLFFSVFSEELINCSDALPSQMLCEEISDCVLDEIVDFQCHVFHSTICSGPRSFTKSGSRCRYCFQLPEDKIRCEMNTNCDNGISYGQTKCVPLDFCMGPSIFEKRAKCEKTDKSQKTALLLSFFLGVFAADRFYLGHYITAVFKLLTFGGFGIAYFIDLMLIVTGSLGPANGALYPERL